MVRKVCFVLAGEGWPSCYVHSATQLFLVVYVDDIKLAGPRRNLAKGWRLLWMRLSIESAKPVGLCLGRHHVLSTVPHSDETAVVVMQHSMDDLLQPCADRYEELSGGVARLTVARAPFLVESSKDGPAANFSRSGSQG